jgi:mutator protein MutT
MRENPDKYHFIVCVEGIVHNDGKYLMITRSEKEIHAPGTISFPGGKVEVDQPASGILEDTIRREILEETGITVKPEMKILKNKFFISYDGYKIIDIIFLCEYAAGEPVISDQAEVAAVQWMTLQEVLDHPKSPEWTKEDLLNSIELDQK